MAVAKINNSFVFDGVDSKDYGVYITDVKVFGAPQRDAEEIEIPGRNGALLIDHKRYKNVSVVYECVLGDGDFAESIRAFRNELASRVGYKALTDDLNDGEYRVAAFKDGLDVSMADKRTGTFDCTFYAKPQRFLTPDEATEFIAGMSPSDAQVASGAIASFTADESTIISDLKVTITPKQAGSGTPSPSNVRAITGWTGANVTRAGKNLLAMTLSEIKARNTSGTWSGNAYTKSGLTFTVETDEGGNVTGIVVNGTLSASSEWFRLNGNITYKANVGYVLSGCPSGGALETYFIESDALNIRDYGSSATIQQTSDVSDNVWICIKTSVSNLRFKPMVRYATITDSTYEPYIAPTTYPVSFSSAGTVYGGEVDVMSGVLKVTHAMVDLGTYSWNYRTNTVKPYFTVDIPTMPLKTKMWCSTYQQSTLLPNNASMPDYSMSNQGYFASAHNLLIVDSRYTDASAFKTAVSGAQLVYELATPTTYQLTPTEVSTLLGANTVWADTGDVSVTYGTNPYKLENPTLFESKPLLKCVGRGSFSVGDTTITLAGTADQTTYIDCDLMECYQITDGEMVPCNSLVTLSTLEYPTLKPGINTISVGNLDSLTITPRFWRL